MKKKERVSATIDPETKKLVVKIMEEGNYRNISHVIEDAIKNLAGVKNGRK